MEKKEVTIVEFTSPKIEAKDISREKFLEILEKIAGALWPMINSLKTWSEESLLKCYKVSKEDIESLRKYMADNHIF